MRSGFGKLQIIRGMKMLNVIVTLALFVVCWNAFYIQYVEGVLGPSGNTALFFLYGVFVILLDRTYNAFDVGMLKATEVAYSLSLANVVGAGIVYLIIAIAWVCVPNPLPLLGLLLAQIAWNYAWSILADKLYFASHPPQKAAVIYHRNSDLCRLEELKHYSHRFDVQNYIEHPTNIHQLIEDIKGYEVVFVAGVSATMRNGIAKYCVEHNVQGYIEPHIGDVIMAGAKHQRMFSNPMVRISRAELTPEYLIMKRAIDIIASSIALVVTSPIMIATALAIKLHDGGPVFYKQVRLTRNRKEFNILKFRSMGVDAEKDGVARLANENDTRITPVGRVIRAIRFDELPQLFNILGGSMTIVGPRPERPEIADQYEKNRPAFSLRLQVKAGLTGYAQIYGRYNTQPREKLQLDLMYINKMSILEDVRLMLATIKILFMRESTQGVSAGQVTAVVESKVEGKESA